MDREKGHLPRDPSEAVKNIIWVKLVGVGSVSTGKTCLIKHFCESKFSTNYQATVGVDYGFKIQSVHDLDLRVHLWDLSGSPEYLEVRNELYIHTDGIFIAFDVSSETSFEALDYWVREVRKHCTSQPDIVLVGNKIDVKEKREVSSAEARKFAQKHKLAYFETSAASGEGVNKMFQELLEKIVARKSVGWRTKVISKR